MRPHHPDLFRQDTPNPWEGVTVKKPQKAVKGHVERKAVYAFAEKAIEKERGELAAAAVLAFEWLMRPTSIGAGYAAWSGYRGDSAPDKIIFAHRETGERTEHPLEYVEEDGLSRSTRELRLFWRRCHAMARPSSARRAGSCSGTAAVCRRT
ncbi:hypothetical protein ABID21_003674 [Pseudorhizobium tarimense]|uniref:Uncharacterized protein n=2 Tax=Pseudorhizobium tarimense TaxID=1079109 RepID=A0ABV2HAH4_9HYPH|nr:hypothetical protein [Pseudorhizobium tarimense]MCJ8520465.1 hypothetical protein [Pseudorhizobium tarimense]